MKKRGSDQGNSHFYKKKYSMGYKLEEKKEARCLECGRVLYGRTDKKFCNDKCKNHFHSRHRSTSINIRNKILNRIAINHNILEKMIRSGITSVSLEELETLGFTPSCITGHRRGRHRHDEYSCFDILYCQSSSKLFNIRYSEILREP